MLLSEVVGEMDDTETAFWTAVESTAICCESVMENDLTSPVWSDVEAYMGCKYIVGLFVYRVCCCRQQLASKGPLVAIHRGHRHFISYSDYD